MKNLSIIACLSVKILGGSTINCFWQSSQICASSDRPLKGHPVVMGSKTFRSIGRPLPHREISAFPCQEIDSPDIKVFRSQSALDAYLETLDGEKFIIGGASLYNAYIGLADKLLSHRSCCGKPADTCSRLSISRNIITKILQSDTYEGITFEIIEVYSKESNL